MGRITWDRVRDALDSRPRGCVTEPVRRAAVAMVLREAAASLIERGGAAQHPPGPPPPLRRSESGSAASLEILFIRRAEDPRDPWSGQIAFPGGRAEPEDPSLEVTAVRETAEEVGLDLATSGECLGALDEVRALAKMRPLNLAIAPYVFRFAGSEVAEPRAEVKSVHWLPLDDLLGPERRSTMEYVHEGLRMEFPCLRVGELVIWGLTYRMLMGLRERLGLPAAGAGAAAGARG